MPTGSFEDFVEAYRRKALLDYLAEAKPQPVDGTDWDELREDYLRENARELCDGLPGPILPLPKL